MELLAQTRVPPFVVKPPRPLAAGAVALAFAALVLAIGIPAFLDVKQNSGRGAPAVLAESATKIKDHLAHKDIQVEARVGISWRGALISGAAACGFLGAALGTASWARRESSRCSCVAIAAGLTAIAWNYFVFAGIAAVGLFLMAWMISHFHR